MSRWLFPIFGSLLILAVVGDVFLVVLYARMGASVLGRHVAGRARWDGHITRLARFMAYDARDIDPALYDAGAA